MKQILSGEILGTFILVFFGCGAVAISVLYQNINLYQIGSIWAFGVAFGIFASRKWSKSHLNPAVTIGFWLFKDIKGRELIPYILGQFIGAILAGIFLYIIFSSELLAFEQENTIIRGYEFSKKTAMMFGEFYPNPANPNLTELSTEVAFILETVGTFALMLGILIFVNLKKMPKNLLPILIGLLLGLIIVFVAPYTQAGLNPARDLGPRIVSYFAGWKEAAFDLPQMGWLTVYVVAPIVGASFATLCFRIFYKT